jgi:protocatechuate 3,4-dioxygenase beta subunit
MIRRNPMNLKAALAAVVALAACTTFAQDSAPFPEPPAGVSSTVILAPENEPGERLVIRGTVYHADGRTPYAGLVIYVYQTDASGVYNTSNRSWREPRLRGWLRTGEGGVYEIRTIKPGSYPGSRNPAHIHAIIRLPGRSPEWIDDFLFAGDPFLTGRQNDEAASRGSFSNIVKLTRTGDGSSRGTRDIAVHD